MLLEQELVLKATDIRIGGLVMIGGSYLYHITAVVFYA
jgi:hypothetical protein